MEVEWERFSARPKFLNPFHSGLGADRTLEMVDPFHKTHFPNSLASVKGTEVVLELGKVAPRSSIDAFPCHDMRS